MASTALLLAGLAPALGSLFGAGVSANATEDATNAQVGEANQALDFQKQVYGQQQQNEAPFLQAGQQSIGQIIQGLQNGTFGPNSIAAPAAFKAPTLADAQQTPGYQFQLQQGLQAIDQGAAARGGLNSGATQQSEQQYGSNLANSTYGNIFNQALSTYNAGLSDYQAKLAGQSQAFNQLAAPAGIGQTAAQGINQVGTAAATNTSGLLTGIGNAQAAGSVGVANAVNSGISGATNSGVQSYLLSQLFPQQSFNWGNVNPSALNQGTVPSIQDFTAAGAG